MGTDNPTRHDLCRQSKAGKVSRFLSTLANTERLMIVTLLHEMGELHVNELVKILGAKRTSISRHLSLLRAQRLLTARRKHNRIYYTLGDPKAAALVMTLGVTSTR